MASVFGHSLAAIALGKTFSEELRKPKFWILGILCSLTPDVDILGFRSKKNVTYTFGFVLFSFIHCLPSINVHTNNQGWTKYLKSQ